MRLFETPLSELSARDRDAWRALALAQGKLISPYLMPEFADMIQTERRDVRVVIAEENGAPVGFFACHVGADGVVRPVGAPLSDYQGFAGRPGLQVGEDALLRTLGARSLVYENWIGAAPGKVSARGGSAVIDLSGGAQAWFAGRRDLHRSHFKKMDQRRRKAEREFGEMRVVFGDPLGERFATLKAWKKRAIPRLGTARPVRCELDRCGAGGHGGARLRAVPRPGGLALSGRRAGGGGDGHGRGRRLSLLDPGL